MILQSCVFMSLKGATHFCKVYYIYLQMVAM